MADKHISLEQTRFQTDELIHAEGNFMFKEVPHES